MVKPAQAGESTSGDAKPKATGGGRHWLRRWVTVAACAVALCIVIFGIYVSGAICVRVLFTRGIIPDGSPTLAFAETVFSPLNYPYNHSPLFRSVFDRCVRILVPKPDGET